MHTIALPTWNSKEIIWLPLEGLARQETSKSWELIVMECRGVNECGYEVFESYWPRLKEAGCKRLLYIYTADRIPLGQKWKEIAKRAGGEVFMLQASDDYPHPLRIDATEFKGDWYDTRFFHSYSLATKKMVLFDRLTCRDWKTGNDMATLTSKVRQLPDNNYNKGIDFFLFSKCATNREMDEMMYSGVNTNGVNAISLTRERHFIRAYPPFKKAYRTIDELGIPSEIVHRLKEFEVKPKPKVRGILKQKFMQYKPGDIRELNFNTFNTLNKKGVVKLPDKQPYEKIWS